MENSKQPTSITDCKSDLLFRKGTGEEVTVARFGFKGIRTASGETIGYSDLYYKREDAILDNMDIFLEKCGIKISNEPQQSGIAKCFDRKEVTKALLKIHEDYITAINEIVLKNILNK